MHRFTKWTIRISTCATLCAVMCGVAAAGAFAAGTGDDPTPTTDRLTAGELAEKTALEAADTRDLGVAIIDAPYRYLYTPTHPQERSYWCGPATVQTIDDYHGECATQSDIAKHMGTTENGTDFSLVDDELRYRTGLSFYYYGGLTEAGFNTKVQHSLLDHGQPLATDVNILASIWPNYMYDHTGHIVPIEAFDWRNWTLRLNDPYDESRWSGGGMTLGHRIYAQSVVWDGVDRHFRSAVVCAP